MRTFAVICGIFLGVVLAVIGFSMARTGVPHSYSLPMWSGVVATFLLPVGYWAIAARRLPRPAALAVVITKLVALTLLWLPLAGADSMRVIHWPALAIFSGVWIVALLPFVRAAIRRRP